MRSWLRGAWAACAGLSTASALVAGLHADVVTYLEVRAGLHRAAVAGLRAASRDASHGGVAPDVGVEAAARAAWAAEAGEVRLHGAPRFTVRSVPVDGWPVLEVEAGGAVALPWGVAAWLSDGPIVRVRGGSSPG